MAVELRRGCGYRKVGGLYLVSDGACVSCDRLPIEVGACPVCGEGIHFPRAPKLVNPVKLFGDHENCEDKVPEACSVCRPRDEVAYLLGVGEKHYTIKGFMFEAERMGVSKRVAAIPKKMELGKTWVFLVHPKAVRTKDEKGKRVFKMGVFSAFVPKRIEMPVWESELTKKKRAELEKRGITPVSIPDGDEDHAPGRKKKAKDKQQSLSLGGGE